MVEELYNDAGSKLSDGVGRIFEAMTSCSTFQGVSGNTSVTVTTQKVPAPRLGDER